MSDRQNSQSAVPLLEKYQREALQQIKRLASAQSCEVLKTKIRDESFWVEPNLSPGLMNLMREEHFLGMKGDDSTRIGKKISAKLQRETASCLEMEVRKKKEQWVRLRASLASKRTHLEAQIRSEIVRAAKLVSCNLDPNSGIQWKLAADFDLSAQCAELDYDEENVLEELLLRQNAAGWAVSETFNISSAFEQQKRRLDAEWAECFKKLESEHRFACAQLIQAEAKSTASKERETITKKGSRTWHSRVKQESLIHTAPVLSPSIGPHPKAAMTNNTKSADQLKLLQLKFRQTQNMMKHQKEYALRGIERAKRRVLHEITITADLYLEQEQLRRRIKRECLALQYNVATVVQAILPSAVAVSAESVKHLFPHRYSTHMRSNKLPSTNKGKQFNQSRGRRLNRV